MGLRGSMRLICEYGSTLQYDSFHRHAVPESEAGTVPESDAGTHALSSHVATDNTANLSESPSLKICCWKVGRGVRASAR